MEGLTRLDMETKVALMAAFLWDGDAVAAVESAIEIEQRAHSRVCEIFRERKLSRSEE